MVDVTGLSYAPHHFALPPGDLWVFGYGALRWNPGFRHLGAEAAQPDAEPQRGGDQQGHEHEARDQAGKGERHRRSVGGRPGLSMMRRA